MSIFFRADPFAVKSPPRLAAAVGLVVLAAPSTATGTVMLTLDLHQLAGRADKVFVGKVLETTARWTADRRHIVEIAEPH